MNNNEIDEIYNQLKDKILSMRLQINELTHERDLLADENEKMATYLLYLNDCNKLDLARDGFDWIKN